MANYIFKKEAQLRLVCKDVGGVLRKYRIDINNIEFSQSFQENSYEVKTLHNQAGFEGSSINRANPAEFSFNTPLLVQARHRVVLDRLLDCSTFDLYISSGQDVFKLEKCIIQDGTFEINKSRPLRLSISGQASKLSKYEGSTIPGTVDTSLGYDNTTYIIPKITTLTLGGTDVSSQVVSLGLEIQNNIEWNDYVTLQGAVAATNAATSMFPTNFTIGTRVVAGAITKYLKGSTDLLTWSTKAALKLIAGNGTQGVDFDFDCSFTNRLQTGEVYLEEYSWRMIERPTELKSLITYTTG